MSNEALAAALAYAKRGWPVLPLHTPKDGRCDCRKGGCTDSGKHPRTTNGLTGATTDPGAIRKWWRMWPDANVGVKTGAESGLVVVDADGRNGGRETLASLSLPETLTVETGDGLHKYFQHPGGKVPSNSGILPGIDRKGDGGYVVAPPSLHANGRRYCFLEEWPAGRPLAALPQFARNGTRTGPQTETPGARIPQGERNKTLTSLAGSMRRRGTTENAIRAALSVENEERCDPPLPDADIGRIAHSVARYEPAEDDEEVPIVFGKGPAATEWPPDAAPEAFHGLAGDIVTTLKPHTEADPHAVLLSLLVAFANAAGPNPYFSVGQTRHGLRLNAVIVAATGQGRKGTSWSEVRALCERAVPDWVAACVTSGLSSGEGLIHEVRDAAEKQEPIKEKGRVTGYQTVVTDPGVTDKRRLIVESEFARTLKVSAREGNVLSTVVRQAWDGDTLRTLTRTSPLQATGAHIGILAHVTQEDLKRYLDSTEMANGFGNRFLWMAARRSQFLPDGGSVPVGELDALSRRLAEAVEFARSAGELKRDAEARDAWHTVYEPLSKGKPGLAGALLGRAEAQTMRLACAYALLDLSAMVRLEHLRAALALWDRCEASVRFIFGDATGDAVADTVLHALQVQPLELTAIRDLFSRHVKAERLAEALTLLAEAGLATSEKIQTSGRPSTTWRAV